MNKNNLNFFKNMDLNIATYEDYLNRLRKVSLSMFEWINLPETMNARFIEQCLFYKGQCSLLKDEKFGFINTNCANNGKINIYNIPTSLTCYSNEYTTTRRTYTGLTEISDDRRKYLEDKQAILVMNDWDRIPTISTIQLFAYRLYEAEMTAFTNIKAQKTPILVVIDEKQRLTMENLYNQYDGNKPFILGDKNQLSKDTLQVLNTDAPFIADKIMTYKKQIWNEALTFLRNK